jgi:hypothetical protein
MPMTSQDMCRKLLDNTSAYGKGCLLWQGPIDSHGYAVTRINGKQVVVHRYVKLYLVERSIEQLNELRRFKCRPCKDFSHCINPDHVQLTATKGGRQYETMPDWRQVYGTDIKGLV